jgi:hypothetical protein
MRGVNLVKKYILLTSIVAVALIINVCTNKNITTNSSSNASNKTNKTQENSDSKTDIMKEEKALEASYKENNDLNKPDLEEARDFQTSLKNGSVIMISRGNSEELEVYNISSLDKFLNSFNNVKKGYVRVIKGIIKNDGSFLVNKLEEYETDGKVIKDTVYDTYINKNKFIQGEPIYLPKMVKICAGNSIRYVILQSKDTPEDMGALVISFDKSSIKN